jgi:hypothetical protein
MTYFAGRRTNRRPVFVKMAEIRRSTSPGVILPSPERMPENSSKPAKIWGKLGHED